MLNDAALAEFAASAYDQRPCFAVSDVHAIAGEADGARVLAIRGTTADPRDWLRDLAALPRHDPDLGWCHGGFCDGARGLLAAGGGRSAFGAGLWLTGHSMGGAIALLLGALLCAHGLAPQGIITFGAPRCGSWRLRRRLARLPVRLYRNGDDPVPEVPWLPALYLHPRKLIAIGAASPDPFADHHMTAYQRALAEEKIAT
jgi:hypothetical protein